jgi:hypothetical protein
MHRKFLRAILLVNSAIQLCDHGIYNAWQTCLHSLNLFSVLGDLLRRAPPGSGT